MNISTMYFPASPNLENVSGCIAIPEGTSHYETLPCTTMPHHAHDISSHRVWSTDNVVHRVTRRLGLPRVPLLQVDHARITPLEVDGLEVGQSKCPNVIGLWVKYIK